MTFEELESHHLDGIAAQLAFYLDEQKFRLVGAKLNCPGLRVGNRRVDQITFSTPDRANQAWVAIGNQVLGDLLEQKACRIGASICSGHTARRDRRRNLQMAMQLRRRIPPCEFPPDVYREILAAAGLRDPRKKYTRILRDEHGAIIGTETDR